MATVTQAVSLATTTAGPQTTGAFTPVAGDLLVVYATASDTVAAGGTVPNTAGSLTNSAGLTFTKILTGVAGPDFDSIFLYVADQFATAVSQTLTWDTPGDVNTGCTVNCVRVAGMSLTGAAAVRQTGKDTNRAAAATPVPAFSAAALTGNPCLGGVLNATNPAGLTPPSGWTELADVGYATPTEGAEYVFINSGFTGTTVTWGSTSATQSTSIVVELDASATAAVSMGRKANPFHPGRTPLRGARFRITDTDRMSYQAVAPIAYQQALNATVGFTGSKSQSNGRSLLAALGFTVDSASGTTIVEDAAAPVTNPTTQTGTLASLTTGAFSPPANCTVVAMVDCGRGTATTSASLSDSSDANATTWTQVQAQGVSTRFGSAVVAYRQFVAAPGSITVKATYTGTAAAGGFIHIQTLTGVSTSAPTGNTATAVLAGVTAFTTPITTTVVGSYVAGVGDLTGGASAPTISTAANSTILGQFVSPPSTDSVGQCAFKQTALTTSPGAITLGFTTSVSGDGPIAMIEFLPATGTGAKGLTKLTRTIRNATIGFTSSQARQIGKALAATVSFVGSMTTPVGTLFFQALNATIGFTSSQTRRVGKALTATMSFTGSDSVAVSKGISATIGFTGAITRLVQTVRNATVGFTSSQTRRAGKALNATLSFTGSLATQAVLVFQQALNATVGFTSSQTRRASKAIAATVGFTGSTTRRAGKAISATVGFTGSQTRQASKQLGVATLSFTGNTTRRVSRALSATVGFTGSLGTAAVLTFTQALNATVGFTASQTRRAGKGLTATVGFTSSQARQVAKQTVAALSFTSSQTRRTVKQLGAGALGFTGSTTRRAGKALSATIGFTGSIATQAVLVFQKALNATVGFTGSLTSSRIVLKALNATIGFTSSQARRTGKAISAGLSFTSTQTRRISKQITATLPFTAVLTPLSDAIFVSARRALAALRNVASGGSARSSSSPGSTTSKPSTGAARPTENDASGRPASSIGDNEPTP